MKKKKKTKMKKKKKNNNHNNHTTTRTTVDASLTQPVLVTHAIFLGSETLHFKQL
jgi:hypothetical protein